MTRASELQAETTALIDKAAEKLPDDQYIAFLEDMIDQAEVARDARNEELEDEE